jgi:tetratricopeptide (TPR) repeat protein
VHFPTDPKWPYSVSYQYYQQKNWALAIDWFLKSLTLRLGYVEVLHLKGYALTALGHEKEATSAFFDCIGYWEQMAAETQDRGRPSFGKAHFQVHKLHLKHGLSLKAGRHLEIAARIHSSGDDVL